MSPALMLYLGLISLATLEEIFVTARFNDRTVTASACLGKFPNLVRISLSNE